MENKTYKHEREKKKKKKFNSIDQQMKRPIKILGSDKNDKMIKDGLIKAEDRHIKTRNRKENKLNFKEKFENTIFYNRIVKIILLIHSDT